jgi:O-antigen ligase
MDFFLFLLVNAALFIRPAEVFPGMQDVELYKLLIIPCLVVAFPAVLEQLRGDRLAARPVTVCVLGLWVAVPLSQLAHGEVDKALEVGFDFTKVVAYYLLFVGIVNTPARLRRFLFWMLLFCAATTLLAVLRFHGVIELPEQTFIQDRRDDAFGEALVYVRLCGTGLFHDPNDFTLLLVLGIPLALYRLTDGGGGFGRLLWLAPLAVFAYALARTQSRGGFLAALVGLAVLFRARFGTRVSLLLLAVLLPVLFAVLGTRQTDVFTSGDTAQARYQLWSEGLAYLRESPLFGIGAEEFQLRASQPAHNSFVHAFAELGLVGGVLFLGAFVYALWSLYALRPEKAVVLDPALRRLEPYVLAVVAGFAAAILSLNHLYTVLTYTTLGLATAYLGLAVAYPPVAVPRLGGLVLRRFALATVGFLVVTYVVALVLVRWR